MPYLSLNDLAQADQLDNPSPSLSLNVGGQQVAVTGSSGTAGSPSITIGPVPTQPGLALSQAEKNYLAAGLAAFALPAVLGTATLALLGYGAYRLATR